MMHLLLQQQPNMDLWQALTTISRSQQTALLQLLLAGGVPLPQQAALNMLERAVLQEQVNLVQLLLPQVSKTSVNLQRLIHLASAQGNKEIVQFLLTAQLQEPLVKAVESNSVPVSQLLLSHGADVNEGQPLAKAVDRCSLGMVQLLLSHGADVNAGQPLAIASSKACRDGEGIVEELLAHGADVNLGEPLAKAAAAGNVIIVQMLLTHGADTSLGQPLVRAAEKGHSGVVYLLLQRMAAAQGGEAVAVAASAALAPAAAAGHGTVVKLLLRYGAYVRKGTTCEEPASKGRAGVAHVAMGRGLVQVHAASRRLPCLPQQPAVQHPGAVGSKRQGAARTGQAGMLERLGGVVQVVTAIAGSAVLLGSIKESKACR
jgi:ankyrin repeat protein